jgi:hypothetical protein
MHEDLFTSIKSRLNSGNVSQHSVQILFRDLEGLTELDVHKFTALRADPRAYMPPSKRNNASTKKAVVKEEILHVFQALSFGAYIGLIQLHQCTVLLLQFS